MSRVLKANTFAIARRAGVGGFDLIEMREETEVDAPSPLEDARVQAEHILAEAQGEAERRLADANAQVEKMFNEAFEQGMAAGRATAQQEADSVIEHLATLANAAIVNCEELFTTIERQTVDLALAIAQKIVAKTVEDDETFALTSVMQALDHLADSPTVAIRVHPDSYDLVNNHWMETRGPRYRDRTWTIVADPAVEPGGCIMVLENGTIDAQPSSQFEEVKAAVLIAGDFNDTDA